MRADLAERVAVVTGASRGIGASVALVVDRGKLAGTPPFMAQMHRFQPSGG